MATGPQKYPGASTAYFYQNRFGGDVMEVNVACLHTTEGRTLPDYGGGGSAPNLTAVPDFAARKLRWFQHFDIDRSSRALVNLSGGVETNTLNVVQVELVGTCDPATHRNWGSAEHIYWPEAPDWALADLAVFLKWLNAEHGVPLVGPSKWPAYPTSYANGGGQRFTFDQWNGFKGVCGHMHVPENTHGDPGAIDFTKLLALAKGQTVPEEDDVALSDDDATKVAKRVLTIDGIIANPNTDTVSVNPFISLATAVRNTEIVGRRVDKATAALTAQVAALSAAVGKLAEGGGLDASEIQAAAQAGAEAALDRLGDALKDSA
jgi:hypothetical protein